MAAATVELNVDDVVDRLLQVRGARPGKTVSCARHAPNVAAPAAALTGGALAAGVSTCLSAPLFAPSLELLLAASLRFRRAVLAALAPPPLPIGPFFH